LLSLHGAAALALDFTLGAGPLERCNNGSAGGGRVTARASALAFLEPTPLLGAADDDRWGNVDPQAGDNVGLAFGHAEFAAGTAKFCVGVLYRLDYFGEASSDTIDAIAANEAGEPFEVGRSYSLAVDSVYRESAGLKLSRAWRFAPADGWSLDLSVAGAVYKTLAHREDRVRGAAVATSSDYAIGTVRYTRTHDDYGRRKFNPFVERGDPDGMAYGIDAGLRLRSPGGHALELTALDAWSAIHWSEVSQSRKTLDNETVRYDVNFNREALIRGVDRRVRVNEAFEPRYRAELKWPLQRGLHLLASDDVVHGEHFPALGVGFQSGSRAAELNFDLETRSLAIKASTGGLSLSITADSASPRDASVLGAELQFAHRW
jgi:hypothetical protein